MGNLSGASCGQVDEDVLALNRFELISFGVKRHGSEDYTFWARTPLSSGPLGGVQGTRLAPQLDKKPQDVPKQQGYRRKQGQRRSDILIGTVLMQNL